MAIQTRALLKGDTLNLTYDYDDVSLLIKQLTLDATAGTSVHVTVTSGQAPILDQTYAVAPGHVVYDLTPANVKMIHRTVQHLGRPATDLIALPFTISISIFGA